jgi:transposase
VNKKEGLAYEALRVIRRLSDIEKKAKALALLPEQVKELRLREAIPILNEFLPWLEAHINTVPPKSLLGDAFQYTLNQWPKLMVYTQDGRLEISNNLLERIIKAFALSRRNWLFSDTVDGVIASARLFSLSTTCKHHNINPYAYFTAIFRELPSCQTVEDFEKLLPYTIDKKLLDSYLPDTRKSFAEIMKLQI